MGLPKKTKLRSSPEEAEFYRRFRERGVAALRQGISRDALLKELESHGVSLLSAERLVTAFEQEVAIGGGAEPVNKGGISGTVLAIVGIGVGFAAYLMWSLGRNGGSRWGIVAWPVLFIVVIIVRTVRTTRQP